ncbi:MAG: hypothetical protein Ta2A_04360 [Treponemataceae bacterium]|nr:MAG: hypothetical protein Ta2A_04360 [Treponemataceae bacterium]
MQENHDISGLILFDKPAGITSFDSLYEIKKSLGTKKVGHTGTLDKFARGLLVALAGRALKLSQYFMHADKCYEAEVFFGAETATLDPEGEIVATAAPPTKEAVLAVLPQFRGRIMQKPPEYSALHIDGKRAHELARAGIKPEMKAREITIHRIEMTDFEAATDALSAKARFTIECSSGTYIRALARDIALASGTRAHVTVLKRTRVAGFLLTQANGVLVPVSADVFAKINIPSITVDTAAALAMKHGQNLERILLHREDAPPPLSASAVFCGEQFITLVTRDGSGRLRYGG